MVKAYGFRHSLKDAKNEISLEGYMLAVRQGMNLRTLISDPAKIAALAHGPLIRTAQSLGALMAPFGKFPDGVHCDTEVVEEFGSDELFAAMTSHPDFRSKAKELGNFGAVIAVHGEEQAKSWARQCLAGVEKILYFLNNEKEEIAVFVSHSPTLELAMWAALDFADVLADELANMSEMDGIVFSLTDQYEILVGEKIPAPAPERSREIFDSGFSSQAAK